MPRRRTVSVMGASENTVPPTLADAPVVRPELHPPTHEAIELRAYRIWNGSAFHDTDPVADWLEAERQLWDEYSRGQAARAMPREQPRVVLDGGVTVPPA